MGSVKIIEIHRDIPPSHVTNHGALVGMKNNIPPTTYQRFFCCGHANWMGSSPQPNCNLMQWEYLFKSQKPNVWQGFKNWLFVWYGAVFCSGNKV